MDNNSNNDSNSNSAENSADYYAHSGTNLIPASSYLPSDYVNDNNHNNNNSDMISGELVVADTGLTWDASYNQPSLPRDDNNKGIPNEDTATTAVVYNGSVNEVLLGAFPAEQDMSVPVPLPIDQESLDTRPRKIGKKTIIKIISIILVLVFLIGAALIVVFFRRSPATGAMPGNGSPLIVNITRTPTISPTTIITTSPNHAVTIAPSSLFPTPAPVPLIPSAVPTILPTEVPGNPTMAPTAALTSTPTRLSTTNPTFQPSNPLSRAPSPYPSVLPTLMPTASPTSVAQAQAMAAVSDIMTNDLKSYNSLQYSAVDASGAVDSSTSMTSIYEVQLQFLSRWNAGQIGTGIVAVTVTSSSSSKSIRQCLEPTLARSIVGNITFPDSSLISVRCGGYLWKTKTCRSGEKSSTGFCIDCVDPCLATCNDNFILFSPNNYSCTGMNNFRVAAFGITYQDDPIRLSAPVLNILVHHSNATSSSALVSFVSDIDRSYLIYCTAVEAGIAVNSTAADIIANPQTVVQNVFVVSAGYVSVELVISNLVPSTGYRWQCAAQDAMRETFTSIVAVSAVFTTSCCRVILLRILDQYVDLSAGQILPVLSITAQHQVDALLTVSLFMTGFSAVALSRKDVIFLPNQAQEQTVDAIVANSSSLGNGGVGTVNAILSGDTSTKYVVNFQSSSTIRFLYSSNNSAVRVPVLAFAKLNSDGGILNIGLTMATNRGSLGTIFNCSLLFRIMSRTTPSRCIWSTDSRSVVMELDYGSLVSPNDTIVLLPGKLKALNPSSAVELELSSKATIQAPLTFVSPQVIFSIPSIVSVCSVVGIDISTSLGSGGRNWMHGSSVVLRTITTDLSLLVTLDEISNDLTASLLAGRKLEFNAATLTPNVQYLVQVQLCTIFVCSRSTKSLIVVSAVVPSVSSIGPTTRSVTRSMQFTMSVDAFFPSCSSGSNNRFTSSMEGISANWTVVSSNGVAIPSIKSPLTVVNPFAFQVQPYTLQIGYTYVFKCTISTSSQISLSTLYETSVNFRVAVGHAKVIANIAGASVQSVRQYQTIFLDASSSCDMDLIEGCGVRLHYSWNCLYNCTLAPLTAESDSTISYKSSQISANTINVLVHDFIGTRYDLATVIVEVVPVAAPLLSIVYTGSRDNFNPSTRLSLFGTMDYSSDISVGTFQWLCSDSSIDLESIAAGPIQLEIDNRNSPRLYGTTTLPLVLLPNSIPATTLTFSLMFIPTDTNENPWSSSITIISALPPRPGSFEIIPKSGRALQDVFTLYAANWQSDYMPLTYSFGFLSSGSLLQIIQLGSEKADYTGILPQGLTSNGNRLDCRVIVSDSLGISGELDTAVVVVPSSLQPAGILELFQSLQSRFDNDIGLLTGIVSTGSASLISSVNCSGASTIFCQTLNRQPCESVTNTCGPCLTGFIGDVDFSNSNCMELSAQKRRTLTDQSKACVVDSDCPIWYACSEGTCISVPKECPNDCSSQGMCDFVDTNSGLLILGTCFHGDSSCNAVCKCSFGYNGIACQYSDSEYSQRQSLRSFLVNIGVDISNSMSSIASYDQVEGILSNMASLITAETVGECNAETLANAGIGLLNILEMARRVGLDSVYMKQAMSIVNSIATASYFSVGLTSHQVSLPSLLGPIAEIIWKDLLPGCRSVEYSLSRLSMLVEVKSYSDDQTIALSSALSGLEQLNGREASRVLLTGLRNPSTSAIVEIRAGAMDSANSVKLHSNPILVLLKNATYCSNGGCTAEASVPFISNFTTFNASFSTSEANMIPTSCEQGKLVTYIYGTCTNAQLVTAHCDGTWSGLLKSFCPVHEPVGVCDVGDLSGSNLASWPISSKNNGFAKCIGQAVPTLIRQGAGIPVGAGTYDTRFVLSPIDGSDVSFFQLNTKEVSELVTVDSIRIPISVPGKPPVSSPSSKKDSHKLALAVGLGLGLGSIVLLLCCAIYYVQKYLDNDNDSNIVPEVTVSRLNPAYRPVRTRLQDIEEGECQSDAEDPTPRDTQLSRSQARAAASERRMREFAERRGRDAPAAAAAMTSPRTVGDRAISQSTRTPVFTTSEIRTTENVAFKRKRGAESSIAADHINLNASARNLPTTDELISVIGTTSPNSRDNSLTIDDIYGHRQQEVPGGGFVSSPENSHRSGLQARLSRLRKSQNGPTQQTSPDIEIRPASSTQPNVLVNESTSDLPTPPLGQRGTDKKANRRSREWESDGSDSEGEVRPRLPTKSGQPPPPPSATEHSVKPSNRPPSAVPVPIPNVLPQLRNASDRNPSSIETVNFTNPTRRASSTSNSVDGASQTSHENLTGASNLTAGSSRSVRSGNQLPVGSLRTRLRVVEDNRK